MSLTRVFLRAIKFQRRISGGRYFIYLLQVETTIEVSLVASTTCIEFNGNGFVGVQSPAASPLQIWQKVKIQSINMLFPAQYTHLIVYCGELCVICFLRCSIDTWFVWEDILTMERAVFGRGQATYASQKENRLKWSESLTLKILFWKFGCRSCQLR